MHATQRGRGLAVVVVFTLIGPVASFGFTDGVSGAFNGGTAAGYSDCTVCHEVVTVGTGSVQILGVPSMYLANRLYNLTVRIEDPDQVGAGYQLSVEDGSGITVGTLVALDTNSQINLGLANHTSTGVGNSIVNWVSLGSAAEFEVTWQAPATDAGPAVFWVAGNAVNDGGGFNGDHVYLANYGTVFAGDIPTVSEWGLIVMSILTITAGTIVMGRRRTAMVYVLARHRR